jgi:general secretion pathway protein L
MCHWIIRKDRAEVALAELGLTAGDVDFQASDANGEFVPVIPFRATRPDDPAWARRAVKLLAAAGLAAVMFGLVAFEWCQDNVAAGLEASLVEVREVAQGGHGGLNQAGRLFAMKADAGILEIWDELSVLPTIHFDRNAHRGRQVTLSDFGGRAIVRILTVAAVLGRDPGRRDYAGCHRTKDRFSISFRSAATNAAVWKRPEPTS